MKRLTVGPTESGSGSISAILALFVLAGVIFLGVKLIPPYISSYRFQDSLEKLALAATYSQMSEDDILKGVLTQANDYGIALSPTEVSVNKAGGAITITAHYTIPVDLLLEKVDLQLGPSAMNHHF